MPGAKTLSIPRRGWPLHEIRCSPQKMTGGIYLDDGFPEHGNSVILQRYLCKVSLQSHAGGQRREWAEQPLILASGRFGGVETPECGGERGARPDFAWPCCHQRRGPVALGTLCIYGKVPAGATLMSLARIKLCAFPRGHFLLICASQQPAFDSVTERGEAQPGSSKAEPWVDPPHPGGSSSWVGLER